MCHGLEREGLGQRSETNRHLNFNRDQDIEINGLKSNVCSCKSVSVLCEPWI